MKIESGRARNEQKDRPTKGTFKDVLEWTPPLCEEFWEEGKHQKQQQQQHGHQNR